MLFRYDPGELLAFDQYPVVSAYLPTDPAGREVRQYAIRLWSLRQDGNVTLVDRGRWRPTGRPPRSCATEGAPLR
jgi:hypothetical protein